MCPLHTLRSSLPELDVAKVVRRDEPEAESIVQVVCVVRNAIHHIHNLGFEQRLPAASEFGCLRSIGSAAVQHERLSHLERQIQAGEVRIAFFEFVHAAKAKKIVVEPAMIAEAFIQCRFARVPERRMADVVGQGDDLGEVFIQSQSASDCSCDLRDLECVRETRAMVIIDGGDENLRLARHAAKRGAVHDAFAVTLI